MEVKEETRAERLPMPGLVCTVAYLAGMVLIYLGERVWPQPLTARLALDAVGAAGILFGLAARVVNRAKTSGPRRAVEGMLIASYTGGILALLIYAAQIDQARDLVKPLFAETATLDRIRTALQVIWPIVWLCSVLPAVFMEISSASMARAPTIERRRVSYSAASGLTIGLVICSLFLINYLASVYNVKRDLSFLKTTAPSKEAREMVTNLSAPFEVLLFFPEVNEVKEEIVRYLDELEGLSPHFSVAVYDQVLEPTKAGQYKVNGNGNVVFVYGEKHETLQVGEGLEEAKQKLAKFDEEFQKKFIELVASKKTAYFTTGHGERPYEWTSDAKEDTRAAVKGLRAILRAQNFDVKPLGIGQGLGSEVPADASVVIIVDPSRDFLPEELSALQKYLDRGGHLLVALDPQGLGPESGLARLIESYGVRFVPTVLANARYFMVQTHTNADRYNLFTNRTSSHASVTTLSRNSSRLAVVLVRSGYLEKAGDKTPGKVTMTLRSMPETWADKDRTMEPPRQKEEKTFEIAAAVEKSVASPPPADEKTGEQPKKGEKTGKDEAGSGQMRMLVVADADAIADMVIGNLGNYYLVHDGLKWLVGEEKFMGKVSSEEDVRIVHTKEQDVVWFYSTIFAVPLVVLGAGIAYNKLRGRRAGKRPEKP